MQPGPSGHITVLKEKEFAAKEKLKMIQRDQKLIADIIAEQSQYTQEEIEKMFLEADTEHLNKQKRRD